MDERTAFLKEITEAFGPPGLEDDVAAILRRRTEGFCEVGRDNIGSFIATKKGTSETPRILIAGHMDEVGFMVSDVEPSGYLRLKPLGGWWPHVLLGQRFEGAHAQGRLPGRGRIEAAARAEARRAQEGARDGGRVRRPRGGEGVRRGRGDRRAAWRLRGARTRRFETLGNENLHVVKAWDNRVGCALAVDLLNELRGTEHPNTVFGVATVQEEIGLRGAVTSAEKVRPDVALAVDVGIARDTPGFAGADKAEESLGNGAQILLLEGGAVAHPRLAAFVREVAESEDIPHHASTLTGGGTDSNRFQISGTGVPSLALCIPSRYIHSHSSLIDRRDYDATLKLLVAICKRLDTDRLRWIREG